VGTDHSISSWQKQQAREQRIDCLGRRHRCRIEAGDFFDTVQAGADADLLKFDRPLPLQPHL
jgi:hypothetical protein